MTEPVPSFNDLIADARRVRDEQLGPGAPPPFKLSDVNRRQRRTVPLLLLILAAWVASLFAVIGLVRPLMVSASPWYGLLLVLYVFASFGVVGYAWVRVHRWFGLRCPHCGAAFIHIGLKDQTKDPASAAEDARRCGSCHAVIIDLDA